MDNVHELNCRIDASLREPSIEQCIEGAISEVVRAIEMQDAKGVVLGVSGGIDSLLCAALAARALEGRFQELRLVGLQMNDTRVAGESYNAHCYSDLGLELVSLDITDEAKRREQELTLPPRWRANLLARIGLYIAPRRLLQRSTVKYFESGTKRINRRRQLFELYHRIRISWARDFAKNDGLVLMGCGNRSEGEVGWYVREGMDDPCCSDIAPIAGLLKTRVYQVATALHLPEKVIVQAPSPGFGCILDEDLLGPYELVDRTIIGLQEQLEPRAIARALIEYSKPIEICANFLRCERQALDYVDYIGQLRAVEQRKNEAVLKAN